MDNKKLRPLFIIITIIAIAIVSMLLVLLFINNKPTEINEEESQKIELSDSEKEDAKKQLYEYFVKKQNTPYENTGKFVMNLISDIEPLYEIPNVEFSGKTDIKNKRSEGKIEIKYSDDLKFPMNYKRTGNIHGIQTDTVSKQYIAIKNSQLEYKSILDIINNVADVTKTEEGQYTIEFDEQTSKDIVLEFLKTFEQDTNELQEQIEEKYEDNEVILTASFTDLDTRKC